MTGGTGPTVRELAVQALSSVGRGYDLLAPKFDATPFRTPEWVLAESGKWLSQLGPYDRGLDLCCGTGAGVDVLRRVCRGVLAGVDLSAGMLTVARERAGGGSTRWVRGDATALPFAPASFELVVSFGALGHFLPERRPELFREVREVLAPGGRFAFPVAAPARVGSRGYWAMWGFDAAMRVRNAVWLPPFVMYYRTHPLADLQRELRQAGFTVETLPLTTRGRRADGAPPCRLMVATRTTRPSADVDVSRGGRRRS